MGDHWVNDRVIDKYMDLIMERGQTFEYFPNTNCFSTFFIMQLMNRGYAAVSKWTSKIDIFWYDILFVPVHTNGDHWIIATINITEQVINYYDSKVNENHPGDTGSFRELLERRG